MCLYYLFHYKKMNELERNPKKYIEKLFCFLEEQGFQKSHRQVNAEEFISYEKDNFHFGIDYDCNMKMKYVNFYIYYQKLRWDKYSLVQHLYIKDEQYKSQFQNYDNLNCKQKLDLMAEYLSKHLEEVMHANIADRK